MVEIKVGGIYSGAAVELIASVGVLFGKGVVVAVEGDVDDGTGNVAGTADWSQAIKNIQRLRKMLALSNVFI